MSGRRAHPARIDFVDPEDIAPFARQQPADPFARPDRFADPDGLTAALERLAARSGGGRTRADRDPLAATLANLDRRLRASERRDDDSGRAPRAGARPRDTDFSATSFSPVDSYPFAAPRFDHAAADRPAPRRPVAAPVRAPAPAAARAAGTEPADRNATRSPAPARPSPPDARVSDHFRALAAQIDTLRLTQDQNFGSLRDEMDGLRALLDARAQADSATLASHLADVERKLGRLGANMPDAGALASLGGEMTDLRGSVTALRKSVAEMRETMTRTGDAGIATGDALMELSRGQDRLAARLDEVSRAFSEASPARALAEIGRRLDALDARQVDPSLLAALGERLEQLAVHGLDAPVAAALTDRVAGLAAALEQTARKADIDRIERGTQRLGALLEKLSLRIEAESGPDPEQQVALAALGEQTEAIRARLDELHPDQLADAVASRLGHHTEALHARLDAVHPERLADAVASGLGALDRLAGDVRASLREARDGTARDLAEISRRLDGFEARLARLGPDTHTTVSLERLEGAVAGISRELTELADRADRAGASDAATGAVLADRLSALDARLEQAEDRTARDIRAKVDEQLQALTADMKTRAAAQDSPVPLAAPARPAAAPFAMSADDTEDRTGGPVTMKLRAELRRLKEAAAQVGSHGANHASEADDDTGAEPAVAPQVANVAGAGDLIAAARRAARPLQRPASSAAPGAPSAADPAAAAPDVRPPEARASRARDPDPRDGPVVYPARPVTPEATVRAEPRPAAKPLEAEAPKVTDSLPPMVEAARAAAGGAPVRPGGWRLPGRRTLMSATAAAAVVSGAAYLAAGRLTSVTVTPDTLVANRSQLAADIAKLAEKHRLEAGDPETTGSITRAPDAEAALTAPTLTTPALTAPADDGTATQFQTAGPVRHVAPETGPTTPTRPETATPPTGNGGSKLAGSATAPGTLTEDLPAAPGLKPRPVLPRAIGPLSLRAAAENGDPAAAHEVALRYLDGRGVPADPALALAWFHKAAESGSVAGAFRVASMYEKGVGIPADLRTAATWYLAAAEAGNVKAMHNLAVLLSEGATGERDFTGSARWFEAAARHGLPDSQFNVGVLYAQGMGVTYDLPVAWLWFALAAQQGDPEAAEQRDTAGERLDGAELANARAALKAWRPEPIIPAANSVPTVNPGWMEASPSS
ncbi:hypothetical protein ACRC7T_18220 [Segnochrobactraceae bacterium EtOH-i3]